MTMIIKYPSAGIGNCQYSNRLFFPNISPYKAFGYHKPFSLKALLVAAFKGLLTA
jgi:hypothetical protein